MCGVVDFLIHYVQFKWQSQSVDMRVDLTVVCVW